MSHDELHNQREWLRVTLSSIGDGVITTDLRGNVTFLNPVAEALTGWTTAEASGKRLDDVFRIINEDSRETVENPATRALREGVVVGLANHTLLISKDGRQRPIDDSAAPIKDVHGKVSGVVLVFRDVAERRAAERALRESEERFRLLVEGVHDYAIFMLDPNGIVTTWNTGAERIKGYKAEDVIGTHFSRFYPQDVVETGFPETELRIAIEEGRFEDEGWRVRKDGSQFWANVIITALRDENGQLRGFSKVTKDLTQRRQLEQARIQEETLRESNRRKDEFLAMLSHELRNPLAPILSAAQLLRIAPADDDMHREAVAIVERQAVHLTRLVDDLLEVSRISTGRIQLRHEIIDARDVASRAIEATQVLLRQRNLRLKSSFPSNPVWLNADSTRLEQVLVNLLTNSAKYTNEGGEISISLKQEATDAVIRVSDTGVGIAPSLLPFVFDLFTQADRSLDRSQGGLGIGLTIVKRVVELHGGTVSAASDGVGMGSQFTVRLPVASSPPTSASHPKYAGRHATSALRLLVVDDNRDAADSMAALLRNFGHEVRVAYSGTIAVETARDEKPDAVLLDIGLPGCDGYEIAQQIRCQPGCDRTHLVALTGYGQESDQQRSRDAGFDAHLVKPISADKLQELLAKIGPAS